MGFFLKGTKEEREQQREELRKKQQEKRDESNKKFEEDKLAIYHKYDQAMLEKSLQLRQYGVTLDHFSGLAGVAESAKVKVEADSKDQCLRIEYSSSSMEIPYADIVSSVISTDVEIPQDDYKTKYMFYIHIRYRESENEKELVFSNFQEKSVHIRDIIGLNYILSHLDVKIEEFEKKLQDIANWDAKFDQRNAELKAERERLLNKRSEMIDSMHSIIDGTNKNAEDSSPADPAAELRKFKSMLEEGLITQEDFDAKKKQLLGL